MNFSSLVSTLLACVFAAGIISPALAQEGMAPVDQEQAQPAPPATGPASTRSIQVIGADIDQVQIELSKSMGNPSVLTNPKLRDEAAPAAVPVLKRFVGLLAEAANSSPPAEMAEQLRAGRYDVQALLIGFGDEETVTALKAEDNADAKSALALGSFIAANDPEAKMAAVKQLEAVAEQQPESAPVSKTAAAMYQLAGSDEAAALAAKRILTEKLKGMNALQAQQLIIQFEQQKQAAKDFEAKYVDKPLTIVGQTLAGPQLSTEQLKGKVVMVYFWAALGAPSIATLPKVTEDFKKYHDQGFEVVAVSLDPSPEPLKQFLAANAEMTWPQIYTDTNPQATMLIAQKLGIQTVPTVFLLDKKGVVRATALGGGESLDKLHAMIPELLKEAA